MSAGVLQGIWKLLELLVHSDNVRYVTLPDLAASITLTTAAGAWTYGVWAQIVATVGAVDFWLTHIDWENPSAPAAGYQIQIGSGAAAAEVGLAAVRAMGAQRNILPLRIIAATRLAGRCGSSVGAASTIATVVGGFTGL